RAASAPSAGSASRGPTRLRPPRLPQGCAPGTDRPWPAASARGNGRTAPGCGPPDRWPARCGERRRTTRDLPAALLTRERDLVVIVERGRAEQPDAVCRLVLLAVQDLGSVGLVGDHRREALAAVDVAQDSAILALVQEEQPKPVGREPVVDGRVGR